MLFGVKFNFPQKSTHTHTPKIQRQKENGDDGGRATKECDFISRHSAK